MTTLTLTYEKREKVARECGLDDPNAVTAEHIDIYSRRLAERRSARDVEVEYLSLLGVSDPKEREYDDQSDGQWGEYARALNLR